jgi:AcrR family transcriptional regulator
MTAKERDARRSEIEAAAFDILAQKGYRSTSMLQIAKRAQASNQTLYAWYGNKQTLFRSIIEENAKAVRALLEDALAQHDDPLRTLEALGPLLLRFTTDRKAIIMNRAAVADATETGLLAGAIDENARGAIFPLICSLMQRLHDAGRFRLDLGAEDAAASYVALLLGETQIRQALGTLPPLTDRGIERRAARALALVCRLYGTEQHLR